MPSWLHSLPAGPLGNEVGRPHNMPIICAGQKTNLIQRDCEMFRLFVTGNWIFSHLWLAVNHDSSRFTLFCQQLSRDSQHGRPGTWDQSDKVYRSELCNYVNLSRVESDECSEPFQRILSPFDEFSLQDVAIAASSWAAKKHLHHMNTSCQRIQERDLVISCLFKPYFFWTVRMKHTNEFCKKNKTASNQIQR